MPASSRVGRTCAQPSAVAQLEVPAIQVSSAMGSPIGPSSHTARPCTVCRIGQSMSTRNFVNGRASPRLNDAWPQREMMAPPDTTLTSAHMNSLRIGPYTPIGWSYSIQWTSMPSERSSVSYASWLRTRASRSILLE